MSRDTRPCQDPRLPFSRPVREEGNYNRTDKTENKEDFSDVVGIKLNVNHLNALPTKKALENILPDFN